MNGGVVQCRRGSKLRFGQEQIAKARSRLSRCAWRERFGWTPTRRTASLPTQFVDAGRAMSTRGWLSSGRGHSVGEAESVRPVRQAARATGADRNQGRVPGGFIQTPFAAHAKRTRTAATDRIDLYYQHKDDAPSRSRTARPFAELRRGQDWRDRPVAICAGAAGEASRRPMRTAFANHACCRLGTICSTRPMIEGPLLDEWRRRLRRCPVPLANGFLTEIPSREERPKSVRGFAASHISREGQRTGGAGRSVPKPARPRHDCARWTLARRTSSERCQRTSWRSCRNSLRSYTRLGADRRTLNAREEPVAPAFLRRSRRPRSSRFCRGRDKACASGARKDCAATENLRVRPLRPIFLWASHPPKTAGSRRLVGKVNG